MDSITQAALGAAIGEATLGNRLGYKGAVLGAIVATLPDLDVVLHLFYSKLDMLTIHRGMSHALITTVIVSLILAYLFRYTKWTKDISYQRLFVFSWLVLVTHVVLDACTAYGTQLLLPFSDERVSFDIVNVVDPVYTLPLLIGLGITLYASRTGRRKRFFNALGLVLSSVYLLSTFFVKQSIHYEVVKDMKESEVNFIDIRTIPVGMASMNWYGMAKTEENLYLKKYSLGSNEGRDFEIFPINDELLAAFDQEVVDKMKWFSKGFYTVEGDKNSVRIFNMQVDMRGIVDTDKIHSPTKGYFLLIRDSNGNTKFDSGTLDNP